MENWCASADILNTIFSLINSVSSGFQNSPGYVFLTQEIQNWHRNCPNTYWFWAMEKSYQNLPFTIYLQKRKVWHYSWLILFF